ncbi:mandelate racemase/muconate lactonizing enzyme family protein [Neolewinella litorea]|uniref:Mandelate racemase/muconate lactonizing enzyme family protein n=1 Tax=Neolewinella litorea TaxID=2562452 RepID=A0A4S4NAX9_9BACT|nr:mandelate racemase/muconate lactonizing enzyme family protein [Neolewinella litorea]THH36526.1 mandelate racemase/muconate lactonizing enzyme family protein [Neolewinella litorea]
MKIKRIQAYWLRCPIPAGRQWRSDYGQLTHFDMTLVEVEDTDGNKGYGEAKAAVGATGACASIVTCIDQELAPQLMGKEVGDITALWETIYSGSRDHYARDRGRVFPILGNRGTTISALSGIDTALWDLKGKRLGVPVLELLGGACRDYMPCYASGGWADKDQLGDQLRGYVDHGYGGIKMRVGVMDETVNRTVDRVGEAHRALGPDIDIMADAHGTFSVTEARRFARQTEDLNLYWLEEPVSPDNKAGTAEVRRGTTTPIAAGESEFTRFDFRDLLEHRAVDILQPDCAIVGGITEARRVAALAETWQLELAPHCWGSAFSFMAGVHLAFSSPSAVYIEHSLGGNPLLYDLVKEPPQVKNGRIQCPDRPGLGMEINPDFVAQFTVTF